MLERELINPKLIAIDGINGCGKTTLAAALVSGLKDKLGVSVELIRVPDTPFREAIFGLKNHRPEQLLLFAAAHIGTYRKIRKAMQEGKWVVVDRYMASFYAYQAAGNNWEYSSGTVRYLTSSNIAKQQNCQYVRPDFYIHLNIPLDVCLKNRGIRNTAVTGSEVDPFENIDTDFERNVAIGYHEYFSGAVDLLDAHNVLPIDYLIPPTLLADGIIEEISGILSSAALV